MNKEQLVQLIREEINRADILKEVTIFKNKHPMKALYIFGPAGSGKSFLSDNIGVPSDFENLNVDEAIEEDFKKFNISLKFASHDPELGETKSALEMIQQQARIISQNAASNHGFNLLNSAAPVIFDTTGENINKMSGRVKAISKLGYDVAVLLVNVPTHVSVSADQNRARTVGEKRTTCISKEFQGNVHKYFSNLASLENVTILGNEMYHNLYDLRKGSYGALSNGATQEDVDCVRTPNGDVYDINYATNLLNKIRTEFSDWTKKRLPINQDGKDVVAAMRYLVKNSGGMLGRYLTDIPLSFDGGVTNPIVGAATEVLRGSTDSTEKTVRGALSKQKPESGASMRSLAKMGDYRGSPDELRVRAHKEKEALQERVLSRIMEMLK